jgi:formate hydrogenlyase subunit 3/multisubunit Na+/H+ antiporter MnhD subunit
MVSALLHPLNIFILGLGGGFLIPLLYRLNKAWLPFAFFFALTGFAIISGAAFLGLLNGVPPIEILTGGAMPPYSINLRFGLWEGFFALGVNVVALLGALHLWPRLRDSYAAMLLYLILIMGIDGMVMTRDLFNLFVFLEIVSIATYGLLSLGQTHAALSAGFKYVMATVLASTFFLLGTALLYYVTGTLNIDELLAQRALITGPIGATALLFVLACLLIELKPFPANGWGLDVYETAPGGVAALVSVGVSAGIFFALMKLLPLFENQLGFIAFSGGLTFVMSNLIGLRQRKAQRLLGYSSIGQMGLLTLALAVLHQIGAHAALPLVIGGLFANHLLAKAGLFWLSGIVRREHIAHWSALSRQPFLLILFVLFVVAIAGLPPFPGFWAKWQLVMNFGLAGQHVWIAVVAIGSLLEVAYLFRWFGAVLHPAEPRSELVLTALDKVPLAAAGALLSAGGYLMAAYSGAASLWLFAPVCAGAFLTLLDGLPGRIKCLLMLAAVGIGGAWLTSGLGGLPYLFSALLVAGAVVVGSACFYRDDSRPGFYPLLAVMLLSIPALLRASTSLEFFFSWEIITLSSYGLIALDKNAGPHALRYLLFSLASAFFLLAGFALAYAANGTTDLASLGAAGPAVAPAFILLAIGFLIKTGALGVHVWLPGVYADADDDLSAILSSVLSKVAIFGLFVGTYLSIRSEIGVELAHVMGWIGLLTTTVAALMALYQSDMKRMLAYSSMSQLGYIVTSIALMSHLGWVTAFYLVANHMLVKGILFLAIAGVILRTGTRLIDDTGGLARNMPWTFGTAAIALVAMSGLPPLMGFGGKWLLLSAMTDKGWYGLAALGVLATFVGLLYMLRLAYAVFWGLRRPHHRAVREAPLALLAPQFILVAGILILSFYPKLLIEPLSAAIDPYFASTLVWEGMSLETIYGYWNPVPVMVGAVTIALSLLAAAWLVYISRNSRDRDKRAETARTSGASQFYSYYHPVLGQLLVPCANLFWNGFSGLTLKLAGSARMVYGGNGQIYALYVLYFFIALYLANSAIWHGSS